MAIQCIDFIYVYAIIACSQPVVSWIIIFNVHDQNCCLISLGRKQRKGIYYLENMYNCKAPFSLCSFICLCLSQFCSALLVYYVGGLWVT